MNQTITHDCITLSEEAYQAYTSSMQALINASLKEFCHDEMELCREVFSICPHTRNLTIQVFNAKNKPVFEYVVSPCKYKLKPPLKNCQDCGLYQSIVAINERLENNLPYCPSGCHQCHVHFERLRQIFNEQSRQLKKIKPKYYHRRVS